MPDAKKRHALEVFSFGVSIAVALALVIQIVLSIFKDGSADGTLTVVIGTIATLAECLAYIVLCIVAYNYVRSKSNTTISIIYAISVTVIVVIKILQISIPSMRLW